MGLFQNLLDKIKGDEPPVKKQKTVLVAKPQPSETKRPVEKKTEHSATLGHAPAQHPITQKELEGLVAAASTVEVQKVIGGMVPVFHPELGPGQKPSSSKISK